MQNNLTIPIESPTFKFETAFKRRDIDSESLAILCDKWIRFWFQFNKTTWVMQLPSKVQ